MSDDRPLARHGGARRGAPQSEGARRVARRGALMPTLISREDALARIHAEGGAPSCLMCAIRDGKVGDRHEVYDRDGVFAFLPRYVRRWGQVSVMPHTHVTKYGEVDPALWAETSRVAFHFARAIERALRPRRVYLASTGSSAGKELVQTSEHLHVHV